MSPLAPSLTGARSSRAASNTSKSPRHVRPSTTLFTLILALFLGVRCNGCQREQPVEPKGPPSAEARVSIVTDAERIATRAGVTPSMEGGDNPLWQPGGSIDLVGLPGEVVAFQVVVSAGKKPLNKIRVEIEKIKGPGTPQVARFLLHEVPFPRRSGGKTPGESLGWEAQALPAAPEPGTTIPDPLIPVEIAPAWDPYPVEIPAETQRVIWLDVDLTGPAITAGSYTAELAVYSGADQLSRIPLTLRVGAPRLPYAAAKTMLYFEPDRITQRTGSRRAVDQYLQLMHAHQISNILPITSMRQLEEAKGLLDGSLFTKSAGYQGAGAGQGSSAVALGSYGDLGDPSDEQVALVGKMLARLEELGVRDAPGDRDVFLYAVDEQCDSPRGKVWKEALRRSSDPRVRKLRVGHTCSEPPKTQAVDLVIMFASEFSPAAQAEAKQAGKHLWIYNGVLPQTGSFLTDAWPTSLRANGWIQARYGIERWFYWESTFWHDGNQGGEGPYDPFATSETFHNQHADHCNGDGVLVYPGRQKDYPDHDLGFDGVLASFRLKQWRRGIQDAGYIELARQKHPAETEKILAERIPDALKAVSGDKRPRWQTGAKGWEAARRRLFDLITSP
ncbi:MAG: glycoside hydrolase domain-containing protein [Polyangiaceae bacterium]